MCMKTRRGNEKAEAAKLLEELTRKTEGLRKTLESGKYMGKQEAVLRDELIDFEELRKDLQRAIDEQ